ncbi:MAG: hypothetical protein ACP5XB_24125 [Isosphaeraceae bacterium]
MHTHTDTFLVELARSWPRTMPGGARPSRRRGSLRAAALTYWILAILPALAAGCSGRGSFLNGGTSASQIKVSLSHLEYENEQLKTEVAKLKEESRSMEDRLVQEQLHNGDLTARLDDARNLLRDRGIDSDTRIGSRSRDASEAEPDESVPRFRTLPAGRKTRKPRKPPAASIPGDLGNLPTASDADEPPAISFRGDDIPPRRTLFDDDPGPSIDDRQLHWQPVASSSDSNPSAKP